MLNNYNLECMFHQEGNLTSGCTNHTTHATITRWYAQGRPGKSLGLKKETSHSEDLCDELSTYVPTYMYLLGRYLRHARSTHITHINTYVIYVYVDIKIMIIVNT